MSLPQRFPRLPPHPQARCMASRTPGIARAACFIAGTVLIGICVPFGLLAGLARKYFGPDSVFAEFETDTCSAPLGLPTCAEWLPQERQALFNLLWTKVRSWYGEAFLEQHLQLALRSRYQSDCGSPSTKVRSPVARGMPKQSPGAA